MQNKVEELQREFNSCQKMLTAVGDEVRQKLLMRMVVGDRNGMRASEIAEQMHITRPAVSHHMQILKDAGIVKSRKEGKYIYYFFDACCEHVDALLQLFRRVKEIIKNETE